MANHEPRVEYIAKGIVLNDEGKRERVLIEAHQSLEYADKAANRMYFDEGAKFTVVFEAKEIPWEERKRLKEERESVSNTNNVPF